MYHYGQRTLTGVSAIARYSLLRNLAVASLILTLVSSCGASLSSEDILKPVSAENIDKQNKVERKRIALAEKYFHEGQYGSAEQAYRMAIETNPRNVQAWLGIAATYDNLKKFPNANRAYMIAVKLAGYTPEILNNLGYHYILRGEYPKARKALSAAIKKQPNNPYILNNLKLLEKYEARGSQKVSGRKSY